MTSYLLGEVVGTRTLRQRIRFRSPIDRDKCCECGHTATSWRWPMYLASREIREGGYFREMLRYPMPSLTHLPLWDPNKPYTGVIHIPEYVRQPIVIRDSWPVAEEDSPT